MFTNIEYYMTLIVNPLLGQIFLDFVVTMIMVSGILYYFNLYVDIKKQYFVFISLILCVVTSIVCMYYYYVLNLHIQNLVLLYFISIILLCVSVYRIRKPIGIKLEKMAVSNEYKLN